MERAAIVTGGGTGIGRAAAVALHRDGFRVVVAGRRPEPLEETRALLGDGCTVYPGDIREPDVSEGLVEECLTRYGRIDCLVNNAGGQFTAAAQDITPGGWRAVRRLNLDAPWFLTQRVAKRWMIANGGGRVISVVLCPERGHRRHGALVGRPRRDGRAHAHAGDGVGPLRHRARLRRAGLDRHRGRARLRARPGRGRGRRSRCSGSAAPTRSAT